MQCLTPLIAPLATLSGTISSTITEGSTLPIEPTGALVWSTVTRMLMHFNGTNWSSGLIPLDIAVGTTFEVSANTQQTSAATMTIQGVLQVEGMVAFL